MFNDELDAGKRVNQLCEELGISPYNPTINSRPDEQYQKREKTSQYKGVYWHKEHQKWYARLGVMYSGSFNDEQDAAKRVSQISEKLEIHPQNPTVSAIPNQQYQKKEKTS